MSILKNALNLSHYYIEKVVRTGDYVIDATTGKGRDTIFLSSLVCENGKVFSFDVQKQAIEIAKLNIKESTNNIEFINDGHENIDKYVNEEVSAVMFNLGYLPGGDHNIKTQFETTWIAIQKSMNILKKNGLISIVVYYGKDSGFDEKNKLDIEITKIDSKHFSVLRLEFVNQINCPPYLYLIEKL